MIFRIGLIFALLFPAGALAQSSPGGAGDIPRDSTERQRIEAARVSGGSPSIDGHLDESAWESARWVTRFVQKEPDQGKPASLDTEVAFLYDDQALYVGARMHRDDPATIGNLMTRRDDPGQAERLIVSLDTFLDRRTAYSFAVTAAGVRVDYFHPTDYEFERDFTFDPVWTARTHVTDSGWTAEMRIPFSQLRFNRSQELVWGVNINRYIPAINEDSFWIIVPRDETGWASRFGDLVGLKQTHRGDSLRGRRDHDNIRGSD
ncbi:MAG: carbohydrate binding family 9 domain-containing protein [Gemmatimonadota bacterium]